MKGYKLSRKLTGVFPSNKVPFLPSCFTRRKKFLGKRARCLLNILLFAPVRIWWRTVTLVVGYRGICGGRGYGSLVTEIGWPVLAQPHVWKISYQIRQNVHLSQVQILRFMISKSNRPKNIVWYRNWRWSWTSSLGGTNIFSWSQLKFLCYLYILPVLEGRDPSNKLGLFTVIQPFLLSYFSLLQIRCHRNSYLLANMHSYQPVKNIRKLLVDTSFPFTKQVLNGHFVASTNFGKDFEFNWVPVGLLLVSCFRFGLIGGCG